MEFAKLISKYVVIIVFIIIFTNDINAQSKFERVYDRYEDTLIIMNDIVLDAPEIVSTREQILLVDSLQINQRGLQVVSFQFNSIALGSNVLLNSNGSKFTEAMRYEIKNEKVIYRFFYIKNIVLKAKDGKVISPSLNKIKITFSN